MRALFGLLPLVLLACTSSEKDDADTGSISSAADEGAEDDDWWDEEEDEEDGGEWEQVDGISLVMVDEYGKDAWFFVEDMTEDDRKEEDSEEGSEDSEEGSEDSEEGSEDSEEGSEDSEEGSEDSEEGSEDSEEGSEDPEEELGESYVGPACIMKWASWEPVCIAFTGEAWGTSAEFDPEAYCTMIDSDSEDDWYYTEDGCAADPKAYCIVDEDPSSEIKGHYYSPMPLSDAEESCDEQEGTFYPLVEEDEEDEDEEYDMGTRLVGYVMMDNSWGFASFEHFVASGENCKANAEMHDITDTAACEECEFSKSFVIGDFEYEIDEGGCPYDELDEVVGMTVTFGHGSGVIFEDEDIEFRSLWYLDDE